MAGIHGWCCLTSCHLSPFQPPMPCGLSQLLHPTPKVYLSHSLPDLASSTVSNRASLLSFSSTLSWDLASQNYSPLLTKSTLPWANSIPELKTVGSSKLLGNTVLTSSSISTVLFSREIWTGNQQVSTFWKLTFKIITTCMENLSNHSSKASEVITYIK